MDTDLPPDMLPKAEKPMPAAPTAAEAHTGWQLLEQLYREAQQGTYESRYFAGALAAAQWTCQWTAVPPLTQDKRTVARGDVIFWEGTEAHLAVVGKRPGVNKEYALGALAWLDWVTGQRERPRWLSPHRASA